MGSQERLETMSLCACEPMRLFRIFDHTHLANHRHFDLTRILQLRLDLPRDVFRQPDRLLVGDLLGVDDDAKLAPRLNREALRHAVHRVRDRLEALETVHVILENLAARAGPCGRERVGGVDEHGLDGRRIVVAVMALHRVNDFAALAVFLEHLASELEVCAFHLAIDRFADVVQQTTAFRNRVVDAELDGHERRELRDFERMHEHVLSVRRAIAQTPEKLENLGIDVGEAEGECGGFAFLEQLLVKFLTNLLDQLFDARRMDAAVLHQAFEGDARDLAANRIEARENDGFGSVVDDEIDAGRELERADVASLASDDASLHVLARQVDDGDRVLGDVVRRHALDGHAKNLLRLLIAQLGRFALDALDDVRRIDLRFVLDAADQLALRFFGGEAGNLLELVPLGFHQLVELGLARLDAFLAIADRAVALLDFRDAAVDLLRFLVERFFLLLHPPLDRFDLVALLLRVPVEVGAHLEEFFLRLQIGFLDACARLFLGVLDDALTRRLGLGQLRLYAPPRDRGPDESENDGDGDSDAGRDQSLDDVQNRTSAMGGLRSEEEFGEPRLSRVGDSYLNLYKTGGRPTLVV